MKTEIDAINAKILYDLLKDGRKSFVEIARECNTSKDVISKRFRQMKSKGVIVGATIHASASYYGAHLVAWFFLYTQPNTARKVWPLILKIPEVVSVYPVGINPSLGVVVALKNTQELEQIKHTLKMLPNVDGLETQIFTRIKSTPDNLSILKTKINVAKQIKEEKNKAEVISKIDETDRLIVEKLVADARVPFNTISDELKISTDTIARRYEKLKQNGDVKAVIQINPLKIGYPAFAVFNLNFTQNNTPIIDTLSNIPDVNFVYQLSGKFDFFVCLMIRDIDQMIEVQEKIQNITGITRMEIGTGKIFSTWPPPREFISI